MKTSLLFLRNGVPEKIVMYMYTHNHNSDYTCSKMARCISCTFAATKKNLKMLEELGIVSSNVDKNSKIFKLTVRGEKVVSLIRDFDNI
jgi:predicted transcriptional regulator